MGILNIFKKSEQRAEGVNEDESVTADVLLAQLFREKITAEKALEIPAVSRCVSMISSAAASLPVRLYRKTSDGVEEITDDPRLEALNGRTGDTMNASEQKINWVRDYLLYGCAYGYIDSSYLRKRTSIYYIPPDRVSVKKNTSDPIHKVYTYVVNGREIYPYHMLKILRNSDGYGKGTGIVTENALALSVAYTTMKLEETLVKKGGNKKGFLKAQKHLTDPAIAALKSSWRKLYSNEGEGCIILNDGMDFQEASSTNVEMQMNENKKSNASDIMSIFGTTDGILSETTVKNAVMPVLDAFEAAFDADLLEESEKGEYYFAFDTRELTRGSIGERYSAYATALANNFMQLDEVRAMEDLPPLGVNFIKLGLNDVLLNPETGQIYTPNTNAWTDFGKGGNAEKTVLTENSADDIMEKRMNTVHLPNGRFGSKHGKPKMSELEKSRVSSGIVTDHPNYKKGSVHTYQYGDYAYLFSVNGYKDYDFEWKLKICERNKRKLKIMGGLNDSDDE